MRRAARSRPPRENSDETEIVRKRDVGMCVVIAALLVYRDRDVTADVAVSPVNALDATKICGQEVRLIDLTHAFDEQTIYWPTDIPFSSRARLCRRDRGRVVLHGESLLDGRAQRHASRRADSFRQERTDSRRGSAWRVCGRLRWSM